MVPDAEPVHLIANTKIPFDLDDVVRDFKRHTSKQGSFLIENEPESRRECLLDKFAMQEKYIQKIKTIKPGRIKIMRHREHQLPLLSVISFSYARVLFFLTA